MRKLRIVDFDCECLPGHWIGGDYVSKVITAVAWSWMDEDSVQFMTHYDWTATEMAITMREVLTEADVVTGHYIRGFDLPLVNGALLNAGKEGLSKLTTIDTKLDLRKNMGRSQSQENLGAMLGLTLPKVDMRLAEWEAFNLRRNGGKDAGVARVCGDVRQHKELYATLRDIGWLGTPKTWSPEPKGSAYRP
jgi:hypothetical protein